MFMDDLLKYSDIIEKNYSKLNEVDNSESHKDRIILQLLLYKILDYYFNYKIEDNVGYEYLVRYYDGFSYSENNITK